MATLRQIGKVHYSDIYFPGHPKAGKNGRLRIPLDTDYREAEEKLGKLVEQRNASKFKRPPKATTWEEFKERLFHYLRRKSRTTRLSYERAIRLLEAFRPIETPDDVTPQILDDLYVHWKVREKEPRPLYIRNKDIKCLKGAMKKAEAWGLIGGQDWETVETDEEPRGRLHYFEIEELRKLLRKTAGIWRTMTMLGARAGLRRGEMRWLHRKDVDFGNDMIHVDSKPGLGWTVKNYERRSVPMTKDLAEHLRKVLGDGREWVLEEDGKRPSEGVMTALYSRMVRKARLKGTLHTLRHTFCSHLAIAGRRLQEIRDLAGHKSIQTTEIYSHLQPGAGRKAIESLPKL